MESLLGLDAWDYATFAAMAIVGAGFVGLLALFLGMPGRIAIACHHSDAEAVNMVGWLGFLGVVPCAQAFTWALKPTNIVDIRNLPRELRSTTGDCDGPWLEPVVAGEAQQGGNEADRIAAASRRDGRSCTSCRSPTWQCERRQRYAVLSRTGVSVLGHWAWG